MVSRSVLLTTLVQTYKMFNNESAICMFRHQHEWTDIIYLLSIPGCLGIILVVTITVVPTSQNIQEIVLLANNVLDINKLYNSTKSVINTSWNIKLFEFQRSTAEWVTLGFP